MQLKGFFFHEDVIDLRSALGIEHLLNIFITIYSQPTQLPQIQKHYQQPAKRPNLSRNLFKVEMGSIDPEKQILFSGQTPSFIFNNPQRMNYPSRLKQNKERQIMEQNVGYAEGSIKEYLNIKRTSKDKCCLVIFFIYITIFFIIAGIGFFFGNFSNIGKFLAAGSQCQQFLSYSATTNTYSCDLFSCTPPTSYGYLQKICVDSTYSVTNSDLAVQISIYSFNRTLPLMTYMNIGIVICLIMLFSLLICYPKLTYLLTFLSFGILLGFAFYLLKTITDRVNSLTALYATDSLLATSQLISDEQVMQPLAYILLAAYLILFPVILFSPGKLKMAVKILSEMYDYFESNYTVIILSLFNVLVVYGLIFLLGFLLVNFATDGTVVTTTDSFFYLYETINLVHPASLTFIFIGVFWLFGVIGSFQQYVIASSVMQWYFEDGGKLSPAKKGLRRAFHNMGSQTLDAISIPLQWITLLLYSICKMDSQTVESYQNDHHEDCLCFSNCLFKIRQLITKLYIKINRGSPFAATLTNNNFIESCELAAVTFSERKHRFFNIGGIVTIFLSMFVTLITLFINYLVIYYQNYDVFPARVSSMQLQVVLALFLGLAIGQMLGNIFGTSLDTLLFCFLREKSGGEPVSQKQIKKMLEQIYTVEEEETEVNEMYEIESDAEQ